jgi:hypothetical protein
MSEAMRDDELPDELPERMVGHWQLRVHYNYGGGQGAACYTWTDERGRSWPLQRQYDTRRPKAKGPRGGKAVEPAKTGMVICDPSQPGGFYGDVTPSFREICAIWKEWRASKKAQAPAAPLQAWPFPPKEPQHG